MHKITFVGGYDDVGITKVDGWDYGAGVGVSYVYWESLRGKVVAVKALVSLPPLVFTIIFPIA